MAMVSKGEAWCAVLAAMWVTAACSSETEPGATTATGGGGSGAAGGTGTTASGATTTSSAGGGGGATSGIRAVAPEPVGGPNAVLGAYPDVAVDAAGNAHLVYAHADTLWYIRYEATSGSWQPPEDTGLDGVASYRNEPDIALDSLGQPHVLGGTDSATGYAHKSQDVWTPIDPGTTRDSELALDSADNVYVLTRHGGGAECTPPAEGLIGIFRRLAAESSFTPWRFPDTHGGLPYGRNNHVYGDIFIGPADQLHVTYRHGAAGAVCESRTVYRGSSDGGATFVAADVTGTEREGPHVVALSDGTVLVSDSSGAVHRSDDGGATFSSENNQVPGGDRHHPELGVGPDDVVYVSVFGGHYNIRAAGQWLSAHQTMPSQTGAPMGFMETAPGAGAAYAVWEEGAGVTPANDSTADDFALYFASIAVDGTVGAGGD